MRILNLIRHGVVSNLANASAKAAQVAEAANDGAIEALVHLGLATLAGLALATPRSETAKDDEICTY